MSAIDLEINYMQTSNMVTIPDIKYPVQGFKVHALLLMLRKSFRPRV